MAKGCSARVLTVCLLGFGSADTHVPLQVIEVNVANAIAAPNVAAGFLKTLFR